MLNPIVYTEKVVDDFLKYQLTAYPFADSDLYEQMRTLLNLEKTRATPLLKGPYISLSRIFKQGARVDDLVTEGIFHPGMKAVIPKEHPPYMGIRKMLSATSIQARLPWFPQVQAPVKPNVSFIPSSASA
jgi:hypothetical protein